MPKFITLLLVFWSCCTQAQTAPGRAIGQIKSYINQLSSDDKFSASVTILHKGQVVLQEVSGYAHRGHLVKNTNQTAFNIASIGKLFTATAILQLYEQGKIGLEDTIGKFLPNLPNTFIRKNVTIHQLLTHTGGLPLWFYPEFHTQTKMKYQVLEDYLPLYSTLETDTTQVGNYNYSNVGYITLGYVIEAVSGTVYRQYISDNIFTPLGMRHTDIWALTDIIPNAAQGYTRPVSPKDNWKTNNHLNSTGSPAGGAYSTSLDLALFLSALLSDSLLKPETVDVMIKPHASTPYGNYGYGIALMKKNGHQILGHVGGYWGIRGEVKFYSEHEFTVAILTNSDQTDYIDISHYIEVQLTGTEEQKKALHTTAAMFHGGSLDLMNELPSSSLDEELIQIKGYYHLNNKSYESALRIFQINALKFPNSSSAQNDLTRIKELLKKQ